MQPGLRGSPNNNNNETTQELTCPSWTGESWKMAFYRGVAIVNNAFTQVNWAKIQKTEDKNATGMRQNRRLVSDEMEMRIGVLQFSK